MLLTTSFATLLASSNKSSGKWHSR